MLTLEIKSGWLVSILFRHYNFANISSQILGINIDKVLSLKVDLFKEKNNKEL